MRLERTLRLAAPGVVALCLLSGAAQPAPEPRVGDPAPPFALSDLSGARRTLAELRGRVVLVYFAMWCSTCRANTVEIQRELLLPWKDLGVQALAVDYLGNQREEVAAVARDLGLTYPVLLDDGTLTGIFGSRMAFTLVIDRDGVLRYAGFYDLPKVKALVGALAGARVEPSTPEPPRPLVAGPRPRARRPEAPIADAWRRPVQSFPGRSPGERFGISVLPHPADLNGDGYPDLAVGSQAADGGGGAVSVWYGGGEGFSVDPDLVLTAPVAGRKLGGSLLAADLDGDGVHDLLVGDGWARGRPRTAALHVGARRGLSPTASWTARATAPGDDLGGAMATGDLDGDGLADLALGVQDRQERGAVYVYYGRPGGPPGLPDAVIRGDAARDGFGASIAVGDLDGDGLDDLVAGAPGTNGGGVDRGAAHLFRGRRTRLAPTASAAEADLIVEGERDMDELGSVVACAGDLDGDRLRELAIAAPGSSRGARRAGAVYLLFGPLGAAAARRIPAAAAGWVLLDGGAGSLFGAALAAVGDLDGDGIDDLAVGAMNAREDPARAGAVYLYRGDPERRLAPPELLLGSEEDGRFGRGVAPLGGARFFVTETGNGRRASGAGAVHLFAFPRTSEERECSVCGMWLEDHRHTRYEVLARDGTKRTACGAQCGLRMESALGVRHRSAKATDFISGRPADAQDMFFVVGSEAVPEMWPSFVAFTRKADAERFQRGFGGEVLDHGAARERARRLRRRGAVHRPSSRARATTRCGPRSRAHP